MKCYCEYTVHFKSYITPTTTHRPPPTSAPLRPLPTTHMALSTSSPPIKSLIYSSTGEIWILSLLKNKRRVRNWQSLFDALDVKEMAFLSFFLWKEKMIDQNLEKIYLSFQKDNQAVLKHQE